MLAKTYELNNIIEYSVSEISNSLKYVVESNFSLVKIRGEVSNLKFHSSGHVYFNLKDENAVINAVCFKNIAQNLSIKPEEGLEVIALGKISTYSGRSNYQIIITGLMVGGIGSLMALFDKRKKDFAAKGYFDAANKKPIPKFPENIYIITSETGAVLQDIIHRITERYPMRLTLLPARVQGSGAEIEIANRIRQANELTSSNRDLIIVARGGGSIEDLWCFNEEIVIQAVFNSTLPIISAIGHETDTTLIDYASDLRAPTPTAAAELATPVRAELVSHLSDRSARLTRSINKKITSYTPELNALTRFLQQSENILYEKYQKTDDLTDNLHNAVRRKLDLLSLKSESLSQQIKTPRQIFIHYHEKITHLIKFIARNNQNLLEKHYNRLNYLAPNKHIVINKITYHNKIIQNCEQELVGGLRQIQRDKTQKLENLTKLLSSLSYKNVLSRGFALVRDQSGKIIKSANEAKQNKEIEIEFFSDKVRLQNINPD